MQIRLNIPKQQDYRPIFRSNPNVNDSSFDVDCLKKIFEKKIHDYPDDLVYFQTLAQNIGLPESELFKLSSIIGPHQIEDILRKTDKRYFYPGEDIPRGHLSQDKLEQIANRDYHFNLHMHTTNSDGEMSVKDLLNQSVEFANTQYPLEYAPSFVIAITDHDTFDGSKEALSEIASNPIKYKNLGVVLGAELSSVYRNEDVLNRPVLFEFIAYSVNPFDQQFNDHLAKLRSDRINLSKKLVASANEMYPQYGYSYDEICSKSKNPKKGIDGFLYILSDYFSQKAGDDYQASGTLKTMTDSFMPSLTRQSEYKINSEPEELFGFMKKQDGFLGISHPGKINIGDNKLKDEFVRACEADNKNIGREFMNGFFEYISSIGQDKFKAIETNYQGYKDGLKESFNIIHGRRPYEEIYEHSINWLKSFQDFAKKYNLADGGGLDTHKENPFLRN